MPIGTPFHPRTAALCTSYRWKDWAGYYAVCSYDTCHEPEYFAFRNAAGIIDVSPLFKYDIQGPQAGDFLAFLCVKDVRKLKPGQMTYLCWCDDQGKVIDDGTAWKFSDNHFRLNAAEPSFSWVSRYAKGFDVTVSDVSDQIAALSVQGPYSRKIVAEICDAPVGKMKFFWQSAAKFDGFNGIVSRTGYTGDLGFELWVDRADALKLWDRVMDAGKNYGAMPAGLDAMDMTRVEAGFILNGVDYYSAHKCIVESRKSSPYEIGLGWMVQLERERFMGQEALKKEKQNGSVWATVGIEMDWVQYEKLCMEYGLPPQIGSTAWRSSIPIYECDTQKQVGYGTSGTWSPELKQNIAIASVHSQFSKIGQELLFEVTIEHERRKVPARVVSKPFFDPARKKGFEA